MPFQTVLNNATGLSNQDRVELAREFDFLRQELDEIRGVVMKLQSLLAAGTAVGAGYAAAGTSLGDAAATANATTKRFTKY